MVITSVHKVFCNSFMRQNKTECSDCNGHDIVLSFQMYILAHRNSVSVMTPKPKCPFIESNFMIRLENIIDFLVLILQSFV